MQIAFIGLGNMGLAKHLMDAGHELTVYNRTQRKADPLIKVGAKLADSPRVAAEASEWLVTMLADDAALTAMDGEHGALAGLPKGGLHISMSTISFGRKLLVDP